MVTLLFIISIRSAAQVELDKSSINNGGVTMIGGSFTMQSSIGQVDANTVQTGGNFSLNGGFWQSLESTPLEESIFKNDFEE